MADPFVGDVGDLNLLAGHIVGNLLFREVRVFPLGDASGIALSVNPCIALLFLECGRRAVPV